MKKLFINARYYLAPLLIISSMFGVIAGGPWVWTGVFFLGLGIVIDVTTPVLTRGGGMDDKVDFYGNATLLNWTMYAMLGVFV